MVKPVAKEDAVVTAPKETEPLGKEPEVTAPKEETEAAAPTQMEVPRDETPEIEYDPYSTIDHPAIEASVAATQDEEDGPGVFDKPTYEEIKEYEARKRKEKKEKKEHRKLFNFTWTKHILGKVGETVGELYNDMNDEEV